MIKNSAIRLLYVLFPYLPSPSLMTMLFHVFLFGILQVFIQCTAQQGNITCYIYDGGHYPDNYVCEGSYTCCGEPSQCNPNRFCQKNGTLIRPACQIYPWTDLDCSPLCLYGTSRFLECKRTADLHGDRITQWPSPTCQYVQ